MTNFNFLLKKYTINPNNKIKKLCEPLNGIYNFKHFWYTRTTQHGKLFTTATHAGIHDYYYSSRFFITNPFYRNPQLIQPGFYYYSSVNDEKFQDTVDKLYRNYSVEAGLFAVHHKGELHTFGYGLEPTNKISLKEIITDNSELLKKFNEYFLKELSGTIKIEFDDFIDLRSEMGSAYNNDKTGLRSKLRTPEKTKFLDNIGLISQEDVQRLSSRELDCLKCILRGLNAPETALKLNLSKRTVEKYIESIKNKLGSNSKLELFEKSKHLHLAGYI